MAKPKFRSVPQPRSEDEFVSGADAPAKGRAIDVVKSSPDPVARTGLDPKAAPTVNTTVRLNEYQHAQLMHLAKVEDRSQSQILRRLLGPALEAAIAKTSEQAT